MTIETITSLIHEHMYDRLNDSNNSNDGREIKHVQERPHKRKWTEKANADKMKKRSCDAMMHVLKDSINLKYLELLTKPISKCNLI